MSEKKIKFLGIPVSLKRDSIEFSCKIGKLNLWNVYYSQKQIKKALSPSSPKQTNRSNARIAILLKGGIGDQLIGCNYVKALYDKIANNKVKIDLFCSPYIRDLFLQKQNFIDISYPEQTFNTNDGKYDLYLRLDRFPVILGYNYAKIQKYSSLLKYIRVLENFKNKNPRFFNHGTSFDGISAIYSIIQGKKRITQCDVDNFLDITEQFKFKINCPQSSVLKEFHLKGEKYITVHRGCDTRHHLNSNKLWPLPYYNELIKMIKTHYPQYKIVQLGVNEVRCPPMKNVDINLVGKTQLADIPAILKSSFLHIDSEGGFVHMRHAIGGGASIVLFGPTSKEFFGYSENINIRSNVCPHWCEHVLEKWDESCILTRNEPLCMKSISPEEVFSKLSAKLGNR